ncbi:MAG: hypothetical protein JNJ55_09785, partial [Betaproteobacteria bacterium]|nr:hypothetical protein [Betaproteobacteria bacterium]
DIPDFHLNGEVTHHAHIVSLPRRRIVLGAAMLTGTAVAGGAMGALAQTIPGKIPATPFQTIGPFYPIGLPTDQDADMTLVGNNKERATGTVIYVTGRVLDVEGAPVANATLDIWQANAVGRYAHPADANKAPLDANFQGFARIRTAADGTYKFKSIKPGAYPTGVDDWSRPPHIHFDVKGAKSRAITQMYFEGEALNAKDRILNAIRNKDSVTAKLDAATRAVEKGAEAFRWDVVLVAG